MKNFSLVVLFVFSSSCIPFKKEPTVERYTGSGGGARTWKQVSGLEGRVKFLKDKEIEWNKIVDEAVEGFEPINHLVKTKCASCHDSDKPLPFYGKIFPSKNIFKKHRDDGLDAVNFFRKFPLKAKGNPPQLSLLKSVRQVVVERTMPIKLYTTFYPFRKITQKDEILFLEWLDPLIEKIERFNEKYKDEVDGSPSSLAREVIGGKCLRCHGNGNAKGGFGGIEDLAAVAKSSHINIDYPEESELYRLVETGQMPPNSAERLNDKELAIILDWIKGLKK